MPGTSVHDPSDSVFKMAGIGVQDRPARAAPDGQRFIMAGYARTPHVNVVLNWFEELKAKVR